MEKIVKIFWKSHIRYQCEMCKGEKPFNYRPTLWCNYCENDFSTIIEEWHSKMLDETTQLEETVANVDPVAVNSTTPE